MPTYKTLIALLQLAFDKARVRREAIWECEEEHAQSSEATNAMHLWRIIDVHTCSMQLMQAYSRVIKIPANHYQPYRLKTYDTQWQSVLIDILNLY